MLFGKERLSLFLKRITKLSRNEKLYPYSIGFNDLCLWKKHRNREYKGK